MPVAAFIGAAISIAGFPGGAFIAGGRLALAKAGLALRADNRLYSAIFLASSGAAR